MYFTLPVVVVVVLLGLVVVVVLLGSVLVVVFVDLVVLAGVVTVVTTTTAPPGVIMLSYEACFATETETDLPSDVKTISPFKSVLYTVTSASRRRLSGLSSG